MGNILSYIRDGQKDVVEARIVTCRRQMGSLFEILRLEILYTVHKQKRDKVMRFDMCSKCSFGSILNLFVLHLNFPVGLKFNNQLVSPSDTPQILGMVNGDRMYVDRRLMLDQFRIMKQVWLNLKGGSIVFARINGPSRYMQLEIEQAVDEDDDSGLSSHKSQQAGVAATPSMVVASGGSTHVMVGYRVCEGGFSA